jgi:hypothetical protein
MVTGALQEGFNRSLKDPAGFWGEAADFVHWYKKSGPAYFREAAEVIDAAGGGPPDRAKMMDVFRRHGMSSTAMNPISGALSIRSEYAFFALREATRRSIHTGIILAIVAVLEGRPKASMVRPSRNFCTELQVPC